MPRTGTATYAAAVGGAASQNGVAYTLSGHSSATFSADFAANSVTTALTLGGTQGPNGTTVTQLGTFNGSGAIANGGPGFTGAFSAANGVTGAFSGAFFGPKALEMGYDWYMNGAAPWTSPRMKLAGLSRS